MKCFESRIEPLNGWGRAAVSGLLVALLAACSVEPTYKRPDVDTPTAFKEAPAASATSAASAPSAQDTGTWKPAQPADDAHRGEWWTIFGDPQLNALEEQAAAANQDLKAAAARVQQARAVTQAAKSDWFPKLDAGFGPTRERASAASQFQPDSAGGTTGTIWRAQVGASYEADLFGRVEFERERIACGRAAKRSAVPFGATVVAGRRGAELLPAARARHRSGSVPPYRGAARGHAEAGRAPFQGRRYRRAGCFALPQRTRERACRRGRRRASARGVRA